MDEIKSPESNIESPEQKGLTPAEKSDENKVDDVEAKGNTQENMRPLENDTETDNPNAEKRELDEEQELSRLSDAGFTTDTVDGVDYLCRENGEQIMPMEDHMALRESSLHNADSDTLVLGKYREDSDNSYENIAESEGKSYFQMKEGDFEGLQEAGLSDSEIYDLYNKPAIEDAIEDGKTIEFTGDPKEASTTSPEGDLNYSGREYYEIQQYADEHGYNMVLDENENGRYEVKFDKPGE